MTNIIVGIAGGTSSGKTTLAKKVFTDSKLHGNVVMIAIDDYYKRNDDIPFEERTKINYDHPNSYDIDLLVSQLNDLKNGKSIVKPIYDFVEHNRSNETEVVEPGNVIIVEGILTLAIEEVEKLCDIKIFVDTPSDIRFIRRLQRDTVKRGRSMESVIEQYLTTVRPMHEAFVEKSKEKADIIIPDGGKNIIATDFITTKIKEILKNGK